MGFIDNIKVDRDLQIQTLCVAFFLVIFPLYFFSVAAGTDSPAGMGGVGKYSVSGEMTYIDFDEGGEYIADGTHLAYRPQYRFTERYGTRDEHCRSSCFNDVWRR